MVRLLENCQDVIGKLFDIEFNKHHVILSFEGLDRIALISPEETVVNSIKNSIGKRIGILRVDDGEKKYFYRLFDEERIIFFEKQSSTTRKSDDCHQRYRKQKKNCNAPWTRLANSQSKLILNPEGKS